MNAYFDRRFGRKMLHLAQSFRRPPPPGGGELQPEPVEPKPLKPLSGGAEAPLDFGA